MKSVTPITIVTPSFNQSKTLDGTIRSVLDQKFPNLEYIIMDGGSTDGSVEIIKNYAKQLTHWQSQADGGQSAAINAGFANGTGDIMGWLNSDDRLTADSLDYVSQYFDEHPECQWLAAAADIVSPKGKVLQKVSPDGDITAEKMSCWPEFSLAQPSVFWRRSLWEKVGGLDESLDFSMDFDLWLKFSFVSPGHTTGQLLSQAIRHPDMKTAAFAGKSFAETCLVLDRHGFHEQALNKISRIANRAFEVDQKLSLITRNPIYRKWREKKERKKS